ncbi:TMEM165/GDT1 family protein [Natrinema sp. H-ect1]|uniref:TMEM165/GDT1 family protein n=1 Tax=Natrinema sp. H-ect1 TaxID=3242700 RepID=UPI00359EA0CA
MTGWLEILVAAFVLQLSVLPGEKVQFIIAGLATRYDPRIVVAAAATAFAGWTAIEIVFGAAIQGVVPAVYLEAITAGLFLVFAALLVRSAPGTSRRPVAANGGAATTDAVDVSLLGYDVPPYLRGFVPIFALMAVGEFGDKTQLVTIGLALEYGARPAIWAGEMLAIVPVSAVNAYFFHRFSHRFDARLAHFAGAGLFLFFGLDTLLQLLTGFSVWETIVEGISTVILGLG